MSKTRITWNIIAGVGAVGFSLWFFVGAYQCHRGDICAPASTGAIVYLVSGIFMALIALWLFALFYCSTYRLINDIARANGKLKFNCGGKSFEDDDRIFLKFRLYSEESPEIPTHVFILLRNGPWLCPYALWKDQIESEQCG